jgi:hypothetical protein
LYKLLGNKLLVTELLFRGSIHGWTPQDFHSRCDHKGPTICLFKIKDGDCIGGFTNAQWSSPNQHKYEGDQDAMLFNLSFCRHFPSQPNIPNKIACYKPFGPSFTEGNGFELSAWDNPMNGNHTCYSHTNKLAFRIPTDEAGLNMLTN